MNPAVCSDCSSPWRVSDEKPTCPRCGGLPKGEGKAKAPPKRGVSDRLRALQEHKKAQDVIATEVEEAKPSTAPTLTNTMTATQPVTTTQEMAQIQAFAKDLAAQEEVGKPKEFLARPARREASGVPYDLAGLLDVASTLEARARLLTVVCTVMGVIGGAGFGASVSGALQSMKVDKDLASVAAFGCFGVGGLVGYFVGRSLGVWLRAAAYGLLCLARIEESTRKA